MSCDNPPGSVEAIMPGRRKFDKTGICIKCKANPGRLVIRHAVYCKACFLTLVTSKFRQVLDPTINSSEEKPLLRGTLKASGNLMIGYSGGLGSTVLLDLVKTCYFSPADDAMSRGGKKHPRKRGRAWDRVIVCYIECCEGHPGAANRSHDVELVLERYKDLFEFQSLRLEDAFKVHDRLIQADLSNEVLPISINQTSDIPPVSLLKTYLTSLPTATSRQSSISFLIRLLLQHTACAQGCSHLLLGTSLTSLSVNLIDAVASGAGFTLGMEKAEDWQGPDSRVVRVVRPLREISMKECAAYMRWRDLSVIGNERILSASTSGKESIGDLTKDFIFGLERDYPSTVSAIVRTCGKLVSNTEGDKCVLCERPAQPGIKEWKERISIRKLHKDDVDPSSNTTKAFETAESHEGDLLSLAEHLCYACHTTLTSRSSRGARRNTGIGDDIPSIPLPAWATQSLDSRAVCQRRARMKEQVQEFLINEGEGS